MKLIEFFRESPEGVAAVMNDKALARALKVLEKRAEVLRVRLERRRTADLCACQRHRASNVVCWACWQMVPVELHSQFRSGATVELRREAMRRIIEIARKQREEANPEIPESRNPGMP